MTNIISTNQSVLDIESDAVVISVAADKPLTGAAKQVDDACGQKISQLIESGELSTDSFSITTLYALEAVRSPIVVVVGLGDQNGDSAGPDFKAASAAARSLAVKPRSKVAFFIESNEMEQSICGSVVGCVGQDIFRQEKDTHSFETILWSGASDEQISRGVSLGQSMNLTRRLVNGPANEIFPQSFAEQAESVARDGGIEIEVWDEKKLAAENCGAFTAVGQGSDKPPRLVIMKYNGGPDDQPPLALVGKGVTFDSGGLSLKPSAGMLDMKCDMTGAATVLGTINAIAKLKLPVNVVGLMGLAENMVSGNSYKLGDVLTARNGKTIEVHNTDAEGRLVLADTLVVASEMKPARIIDLATLTGACVVALGLDISGVMTNDQPSCDALLSACDRAGELAWQLPMHDHFAKQIKSKVADIKNVGEGRWGGAITAGKFLEEFVDAEIPWVHIDIAGPSFLDKPKPWADAGASGCMVRSLVKMIEDTI